MERRCKISAQNTSSSPRCSTKNPTSRRESLTTCGRTERLASRTSSRSRMRQRSPHGISVLCDLEDLDRIEDVAIEVES